MKELSAQQLRVGKIKSQIALLKFELKKTDFKALKHSEGWYTEEEYAPTRFAREELRKQIRELEAQL